MKSKCPIEGCGRKAYWIGAPVTLCYPHNKESYPDILSNYLVYKRRKATCRIPGCKKYRIKSGLCHTHAKSSNPVYIDQLNNKRRTRYSERTKEPSFRENKRQYESMVRKKYRQDVLRYYSKGTMMCACCREDIVEFLSIDHINGHTIQDDVSGFKLYVLLRTRGYPEGYRVLCHNCNQAIGYYGYCPHNKLGSLAQDVYDTPNETQAEE